MKMETTEYVVRYSSREECKELIYELMNGMYNLRDYPRVESAFIKDEFAEGEFCERAFEEVYEAKKRICKKLGTAEDHDVELIIRKLQEIGHHLAMKMYDYGEMFHGEQK